jgi:hypothetical protein
MSNYDYPPSEHIRQYEPFEPNSHLYVRGDCLYEGKKYPCEFEVAYTLTGQIYIVCYLGRQYDELFSIPLHQPPMKMKIYVPKNTSIEVDFSGVDLRNGHIINVKQAISTRNSEPPIFIADSYTVKVTDRWTLRNTPRLDTSFEIINMFGIIDKETAIFNLGKSRTLTLNLVTQPTKGSTDIENSTLSIPRNCIPIGWKVDDVAELWCSCISITTGTDIRWIKKLDHTKQAITRTFVYRQNIVRNLRTEGVFRTHYPSFWVDETVHEFVSAAFSDAWNRKLSVKAAQDYARLMWHFVEYRLITNRAEDQARLISTTVEELLTLWEKHTGNIPSPVVSSDEAVLIWSDIESNYLENLRAITGITDKDRLEALKSRLKTFYTEEILRLGFGKRLKKFFALGKNDTAWFKTHVPKSRLDSFVSTRNKIAHEGKFPSEDSNELFEYYYDMLMILPLMFFSIFGYRGDYFDVAKNYRRVKASRLAQQKSQETDQDTPSD